MASDRTKRIGLAVLKVLVERAIDAIPGGVYVSIGFDIATAIHEEMAETQQSREQILDALHALTHAEATAVVDASLNAPGNRELLSTLTPDQRSEVRNRLIAIPSELDRIMQDIDDRDRRAAQDAAEQAARAKAEELAGLHEKLLAQMRAEDLAAAHATVEQIVRRAPGDREALKAQAWLERRLGKTLPGAAVRGGLWGLVAAFVGAVAGSAQGQAYPPVALAWVALAFVVIGALGGVCWATWNRVDRWNKLR